MRSGSTWKPLPLSSVIHLLSIFQVSWILGTGLLETGYTQVTTSITPTAEAGSLGTSVSAPSGNAYGITGGTRVGTNLFHSFDNFSIGAADTANFLNTPVNGSLPLTSNILGRVTGGNVSNIFGTVQTTGFGNANIFLMNPAGFLFGPNAKLNVGGLVTFTSADYIKLAEGGRFNANRMAIPTDILSAAPIAAFGFLGSNPGAITVRGSHLSMAEGSGISFIGGNITIESAGLADGTVQPAKLIAPSGQVNLVSVASVGEVVVSTFEPAPPMALGVITLGEGSFVDVSGNASGMVRIRGGSLVMDQAVISADTMNANGAPVAIDIAVAENVSIANIDAPALIARTIGSANAGAVKISSGNLEVTSRSSEAPSFFSTIDTHTTGQGNAGNISINTGNLTVAGDALTGASVFIDSGTSGTTPGRGGDISITGKVVDFQDITINTGNLLAFFLDEGGAGRAGDVKITADRINMTLSQIVTDSNDFVTPIGTSGDIALTAHEINLELTGLSTTGNERSGTITITSDQFSATESGIQAITNLGPGGEIRIEGRVIEFMEGSNIASSTMGDGHAGPIIITATDHVGFWGSSQGGRPGGVFNNSFGENGSLGNAGDVLITAPKLQLTGGTRLNTTTATSGRGGNVTINSRSISMSGENGGFESEPLFNLGTVQSSGIYTRTIGGKCLGPCGTAGNILINTGFLSMSTGSQINSGTSSSGQGGDITITAASTISMSDTLSSGQSGGIQSRSIVMNPDAGTGGNISLTAGHSISVSNGAAVSASSTGPGNAGNIKINAGQHLDVQNGSITTQANQASGGNIDIRAIDMVHLVNNSEISTSVLAEDGKGGNIFIDPNVVVLQGSDVTATAVGGAGGNITFVTPLFLTDLVSRVSATSQRGPSGTVNILSPLANLSSTVGQLVSKTSPPQMLLQSRCVALAGGEQSTFIVAGRDRLPSEPGGWLSSPVSMEHFTGEGSEPASGPSASARVGGTAMLSLRRLTPPGFLVRSFAVGPTGCPS